MGVVDPSRKEYIEKEVQMVEKEGKMFRLVLEEMDENSYINTFLQTFEQGLRGDNILISTGFPKLDEYMTIRKKVAYLIGAYTGAGKCLAKGTEVLMYDGSFKCVENLEVGDFLMGIDSKPNEIVSLGNGKEEMFQINQKNSDSYTVNKSHILSLTPGTPSLIKKYGNILNISIDNYLKLTNFEKSRLYGYCSPLINFSSKEVSIDPYFLGLWLGDGTSSCNNITNVDIEVIQFLKDYAKSINHEFKTNKTNITHSITKKISKVKCFIDDFLCEFSSVKEAANFINRNVTNIYHAINYGTFCANRKWERVNDNKYCLQTELVNYCLLNNKHIPFEYLLNSKEVRYSLLAGLIDSDGHLVSNGSYEIIQKNKKLAEDICYLCRSLGMRVYFREKVSKMKREDNSIYSCIVYRLSIKGDFSNVPIKINRKKSNKHRNKTNITNITVKSTGIGEYYGFTLKTNPLFILKDFTVTHNTTFVDECFVFNPCEWFLKQTNPDIDLKVIYWSLERSMDEKIARWISRKIFLENQIIIPPDLILSRKIGLKLRKDEELLVRKWLDTIKEIMDKILTVHCGATNPNDIYRRVKEFAEKRGIFEKVVVRKSNGYEYFKNIYISNNPREFVLLIADPVNRIRTEKNSKEGKQLTKKEAIEKLSEHFLDARDLYGYSTVETSQFNRSIVNQSRLNSEKGVSPSLEDFKETGNLAEDAEVVLSVFDPSYFKVNDIFGYDLGKLKEGSNNKLPGNKKYRQLQILKNSYGPNDVGIGLAFQPQTGVFQEMPKLDDMTDDIYNEILDDSYFLKHKRII